MWEEYRGVGRGRGEVLLMSHRPAAASQFHRVDKGQLPGSTYVLRGTLWRLAILCDARQRHALRSLLPALPRRGQASVSSAMAWEGIDRRM